MRVTPAALSDSTSSSDGSSYTFETSYTNASREYQSRPKARSTVRKLSEQEKKEIRLKFRPTSDSGVEIESQKDISRGTTRFEKRLLNGEANITKASLNRKNILRSPFSSGESTMKKQYSGENDGVLNKATSKKQENSAVQRSNKEEANSQSQETSIVQRSITDIACFSKAYHLDKNVGHWKPIIKASPPVDLYPMVRMVSDFDDVQIPIGWQADLINGIFGVPSDKFLETKGPQSLYCYEYASNSNIDVSYSKFGDVLTSFLGIRRLDHPPLLKSDNSNNILVRVEASTISETDCAIRKGNWWGQSKPKLPITPGVDFVGKICKVKYDPSSQHNLKIGQTVLSLVKWGGNTRFFSLDPERLIKVPEGIDPSQAVCLPQTYLSAFQVLHFGQIGLNRYTENSLQGKSVLIIGSITNSFGKAIIELALNAGTSNLYATAKKADWGALIELGIIPLSTIASDWIRRLEGTVDLVLVVSGDLREDITPIHCRTLLSTGHLIVCGHRKQGTDIPIGDWNDRPLSLVCRPRKTSERLMERTHSYDVFEQWDLNLTQCKQDLEHLLSLLEYKIINPKVLERIPIVKVSKAHKVLESKRRFSGFLVCEPWMKEKKRALYL